MEKIALVGLGNLEGAVKSRAIAIDAISKASPESARMLAKKSVQQTENIWTSASNLASERTAPVRHGHETSTKGILDAASQEKRYEGVANVGYQGSVGLASKYNLKKSDRFTDRANSFTPTNENQKWARPLGQ